VSKEISNLKEFLIQQGKEIVKIKQENKVNILTLFVRVQVVINLEPKRDFKVVRRSSRSSRRISLIFYPFL
jgi:hypothetical protein